MSDPHPYVTIVSGVPRSGTSMMMRMLTAGGLELHTDAARSPDPDNPQGYYEFERAKQLETDKEWVPEAVGKAVKVIYLLLKHLPPGHEYRILMMRRRLEEVVASQKRMLERLGHPGGGLDDARTMEIFKRQMEEVESWAASQEGFSLLNVDYNRLVTDPRAGVDEVNAFLGGDLDTDAMVRVVDPSLYRQRAT